MKKKVITKQCSQINPASTLPESKIFNFQSICKWKITKHKAELLIYQSARKMSTLYFKSINQTGKDKKIKWVALSTTLLVFERTLVLYSIWEDIKTTLTKKITQYCFQCRFVNLQLVYLVNNWYYSPWREIAKKNYLSYKVSKKYLIQ